MALTVTENLVAGPLRAEALGAALTLLILVVAYVGRVGGSLLPLTFTRTGAVRDSRGPAGGIEGRLSSVGEGSLWVDPTERHVASCGLSGRLVSRADPLPTLGRGPIATPFPDSRFASEQERSSGRRPLDLDKLIPNGIYGNTKHDTVVSFRRRTVPPSPWVEFSSAKARARSHR